jgi:hypothetical protein
MVQGLGNIAVLTVKVFTKLVQRGFYFCIAYLFFSIHPGLKTPIKFGNNFFISYASHRL